MRAQASLEFLLVMSAISALCLTAVLLYGGDIKLYSANQIQANPIYFQPPNYGTEDNSSLIAYLNTTSVNGSPNPIYLVLYGCSYGYANITIASNASSILNANMAAQFSNILSLADYFVPYRSGQIGISINYSITCKNSTVHRSYELSSFSQNLTKSNPPTQYLGVSASITQRNESTLYNLSSQPVYNLGQDNGCTAHDFSGNPLPVAAQCGTSNAWDYMVFSSSCYTNNQGQTATYCIYPDQTGYYLRSINPSEYRYEYAFSLTIYNGTDAYSINLNSTQGTFPVYVRSEKVGVANVLNVYSQEYAPDFSVLSNSSSTLSVNTSYETKYGQAMNSAFATLAFYNSTGVDGSTQSEIEQQISSFNKSSSQLLGSKNQLSGQCKLFSNYLQCNSLYHLDYVINVTLTKDLIPNSTITVQGSQIFIRG